MHVVHLCQVLHPVGDAPHHPHQLHHLELPIIGPEERVQRTILHVLSDDHDRGGLSHNTLQNVNMLNMLGWAELNLMGIKC